MEHAFKTSFEKAPIVNPEFLKLLENRPALETQVEQRAALARHDSHFEHLSKYEELLQKWASRYGSNIEIRKNSEGMIEIPFTGLRRKRSTVT